MMKFKAALALPGLLYGIFQSLKTQRHFLATSILPVVDKAMAASDGSLDISDRKKIKEYYGLAVPAILGEAFCVLRGTKMTPGERMASTCQGAMTGLFDDFFDKKNMSEAELEKLIESQQESKGNSSEKLFLHFYTTALSNCRDPGSMKASLWKVYAAQVESKKQMGAYLSMEEIKQITIDKGAYSLLFYRSAFDHPLSRQEEALLFQLGALMQLSNDIFDVYKDQQQNISTLVTKATHITDVRGLFIQMLNEAKALAHQCDFSKAALQKFWGILSIGIFSRSLVCLDQLESKEKLSGGKFVPAAYSRKDLICDMDLAVNKWRSVKNYFTTRI